MSRKQETRFRDIAHLNEDGLAVCRLIFPEDFFGIFLENSPLPKKMQKSLRINAVGDGGSGTGRGALISRSPGFACTPDSSGIAARVIFSSNSPSGS